jgi:hypothetical protein
MYRLISIVLGGWLLLAGVTFAAEEKVVTELTCNGSRTTRSFTVIYGWEVRWTATNELSLFLFDAQGQRRNLLSQDIKQCTLDRYGDTTSLKLVLFTLPIILFFSWIGPHVHRRSGRCYRWGHD